MKQDYLLLGEILRPQGIRGEVKARHYTDDPRRFLQLKEVFLKKGETMTPYKIQKARVQQDDIYLLLEGVETRNQAEELRDMEIWVDRAHARKLAENEFYIADLIGAKAYDTQGNLLGVLKDVTPGGGANIFTFSCANGEMMLPALESVIVDIDVEGARITLNEETLDEVALYEDSNS